MRTPLLRPALILGASLIVGGIVAFPLLQQVFAGSLQYNGSSTYNNGVITCGWVYNGWGIEPVDTNTCDNFACDASNNGRSCTVITEAGTVPTSVGCDNSTSCSGGTMYEYVCQSSSYTCVAETCSANSACAANTCSNSTCSDSCGNVYAGTKTCTPPTQTCRDYGYEDDVNPLGSCDACPETPGSQQYKSQCATTPPDVCPATPGTQTSTSQCTCQDYGYNYGAYVGCCYNNADRSDDACYTPPDVCPATPGNQSSYSQCNCTDNPSGPGCYVAPQPQCSDYGQLGTYPNCYNAPQPTCADYGQLGTYPNCYTAPTCVSYQYSSCSSQNSCGMANYGTYQCDGSCSASAPSESLCPVTSATANLSANPSTVTPGGGSTLSYSCTNSNYAELYPSVGSVTPVSGGSRTVYPSSATQYTLYCYANTGGYVTATAIVEVSAYTPQPNLTAGYVSPSSGNVGESTYLSASISNNGDASTGGSFPNIFQLSDGTMISAGTMGALGAYGSNTASANYTFSSAGSYQVRACADNNTGWGTSISESNEGDNCGPWSTITVAPSVPASVSCTVTPSSVAVGGSVTYSANPSNGAYGPYTWSASDGVNVGSGSSAARSFSAPGTYGMSVSAANTGTSYCPNVSATASYCAAGSSSLSITASPTRVKSGQTTTLTWSASNVQGSGTTCTVTGPGVSWSSPVSASPSCSASSSASPTITTQGTYTLTCGGESKSVTVNVIPNVTEF